MHARLQCIDNALRESAASIPTGFGAFTLSQCDGQCKRALPSAVGLKRICSIFQQKLNDGLVSTLDAVVVVGE